jgi:hypothetical protein
MNPCRGEFIRLSINGIRRYCDISYLATEVAPTKFPTRHANYAPCRGEFIRLGINGIRGCFNFSYLATDVAPTKCPARHANYEPCRGEFIRLSISRIRGYFDICYRATEVAPTKFPARPTKKPTHHETLNHKNKKPNVSSVFILSLLMRLTYLLTDEINHQLN